jgi:hypothetical protein
MINPAYALPRGFADVGLGAALCLSGEADEAARILTRTAAVAAGYGSERLAGEVPAARNQVAALARTRVQRAGVSTRSSRLPLWPPRL